MKINILADFSMFLTVRQSWTILFTELKKVIQVDIFEQKSHSLVLLFP